MDVLDLNHAFMGFLVLLDSVKPVSDQFMVVLDLNQVFLRLSVLLDSVDLFWDNLRWFGTQIRSLCLFWCYMRVVNQFW